MKKYKKEIEIIDEQIIVKILDIDNKIICSIDFDKNHIMRLGNRYLEEHPYCITDQSSALDEMFHFIVLDIQEKLNLTKFIPLQNEQK